MYGNSAVDEDQGKLTGNSFPEPKVPAHALATDSLMALQLARIHWRHLEHHNLQKLGLAGAS